MSCFVKQNSAGISIGLAFGYIFFGLLSLAGKAKKVCHFNPACLPAGRFKLQGL
jgi:hypothetical protein